MKRFEVSEPFDEENKENFEGEGHLDNGSYEDLCIKQNPISNDQSKDTRNLTKENMESLAKAALLDLQKLIQEVSAVVHRICSLL